MDFNKIFKYSWDLFVKDIVPLIVGGLIAGILGGITLGILIGPLYGGLFKMIIRRVRENKQPEIGDIFSAMDQFGTLFLTTIVLTFLTFLGMLLCIIPGLLLATIWIYVLVYIVDKKVSMGEAMSMSKSLVSKIGLGMHLVMILLLGFISALLSITYIGSFIALPFYAVVVCVMYFIFNNEEHLLLGKTPSSYFEVKKGNDNLVSNQAINQPYQSNSGGQVAAVPSSPSEFKNLEPAVQAPILLVCVSCGSKASGGAFCTECGSPLASVCAKCRKELVKGAKFCPSCGSKLG